MERKIKKKIYVYQVNYLVKRFGFVGNAFWVNYSVLDNIKAFQFLFYLYKKGYKIYNLSESRQVIIKIENSKQRRKLYAILRYYGLIQNTRKDIIVSEEKIGLFKEFAETELEVEEIK